MGTHLHMWESQVLKLRLQVKKTHLNIYTKRFRFISYIGVHGLPLFLIATCLFRLLYMGFVRNTDVI